MEYILCRSEGHELVWSTERSNGWFDNRLSFNSVVREKKDIVWATALKEGWHEGNNRLVLGTYDTHDQYDLELNPSPDGLNTRISTRQTYSGSEDFDFTTLILSMGSYHDQIVGRHCSRLEELEEYWQYTLFRQGIIRVFDRLKSSNFKMELKH